MSTTTRQPASLRLVLPLPPSINRQYANAAKGRVLTAEARTFKRDVKKLIDQALLSNKISTATEKALQKALIGVYLTFYFETPKRRDLDGGLKIALDAICAPLGIDDRAVVDLHLIKQIDPLRPRLEVEIEAIENWSFDPEFVLLEDANEAPAAAAE
ncbi:MAG: RusA family crossover junction endodeoxyribonuclease [Thermomicrobiales bacterium]|nr:RusA family crossover junction endodeoxyribonuclease [Thermomicrobiales bacterium]